MYNSYLFREVLGAMFSPWLVDRTTFLLEPFDEKGNKVFPENYNPIGYRDDILIVLIGFVSCFCVSVGFNYIRSVKSGKLYID